MEPGILPQFSPAASGGRAVPVRLRNKRSRKRTVHGWRIEALSTTRLAGVIPLVVALVWMGLLARALAT